MPPQLATLIYGGFVAWLFRRDFRERPNVTGALWLPFVWLMISMTRFLSQWLAVFGLNVGAVSVEEGSPVDACLFFVLITGGLYVLYQRRVSLAVFMSNNRWITLYLVYCLLAVLWSDYSFVATKRWVKLFGQPVMVLVLLTEPDPMEAFNRLMKRCAYVIVPLSILFIKYFPEFGRGYDQWSGMAMNTGITMNKNTLGCDCFVLGLFFVWHFQRVWRNSENALARKKELALCLFFFLGIGWLLYKANSSTSVGALGLSVAVMIFLGLKMVNPQRIGFYLLAVVVLCGLAEFVFGLHTFVLGALGRDTTLTGRTDIWQILLHWDLNPFIGVGFESFWLGDERREKLWELYPGNPLNEAHNGYLETYIQIGLVGVFLTVAMLLAAYFKSRRSLLDNFDFGRFRLAYLAAFILYNWTEAAFRTHCFPFFMFFLIAIDYPISFQTAEVATDELVEPKTDMSLAGDSFFEQN